MKNNYQIYLLSICFLVLGSIFLYINSISQSADKIASVESTRIWSTKKTKVKSGENAFMKPDGFINYYNNISKRLDENSSGYVNGYKFNELSKSLKQASQARLRTLDAEFKSRGPGNVGGRTRAIAVDPTDNTNCTWVAGAASGGIWKTTDCGQTWENISPDLPNLSTNSIAQSFSNPDVIYVGTGEVFAGNTTFVRGEGIYKSTDGGSTWSLLTSTVNNEAFLSVNRIQVDPSNEDVLVVATNDGIYKSLDGGGVWDLKYDSPQGNGATFRAVQDLQTDPNDYNVQYAGVNGLGILKSTDAGETWINSSSGIVDGIRFEIAVAPSDPSIVYTSSYVASTTYLYYSNDSGQNWNLVEDPNYDTNFLGAQGWYDNTIAVNPYNPNEVFVGGVSIGKYLVDPSNVSESERRYIGVDFESVGFLSLFSFGADFQGGALNIATGNFEPSTDPVTVEIRWGDQKTQKAHRFTVPADGGNNNDGGAGIPLSEHSYKDYIDVPFEVWDVENNRQLMVSFRDQEADGVFNLNPESADDPSLLTSREYIYIHDLEYDDISPNTNVSEGTEGIAYANMYFFWPTLADNATWDPSSYSNAILRFNYGKQIVAAATAEAVYDAYGSYAGQNQRNLHPDHHHLTFIEMDDTNETFMIVNGNDGGLGLSTDNGKEILQITDGYVTTQFYGADKKPGEEKYIGGTQDNGTWVSSNGTVDETNNYKFVIGGDGFEVLWHPTETDLVLGSIYNNRIQKSSNGGQSFLASSTGIVSGDGPFITRLAGSRATPNTVYALGEAGVYKSTNFGGNWSMKTIDNVNWGRTNSANDVEVSLANSDIVWAGAGMANTNIQLKFFVSIDAGETFEPVNNYNPLPNAFSTGIYTHPIEDSTAYALFSQARSPKILKTTDLGQSWVDISGFADNNGVSDRGFPDVFVHSLLVMPFNTDIIWAGTEIGLYESLDGGLSWNIRNDIPSVSIWSMKVVDEEVVIGTHGRGIWSAIIPELAKSNLNINSFSYLGYGDAELAVELPVSYDRLKVIVNDSAVQLVEAPAVGNVSIGLSNFQNFDGADIQIVGELEGVQLPSMNFSVDRINVAPEILGYESSIEGDIYPVTITMENNEPFDKSEVYFGGDLVFTDDQSVARNEEVRTINFTHDKKAINSVQIKSYINGLVFTSNGAEGSLITSNESIIEESIRIYPNPTSDYLTISSSLLEASKVNIYTAKGVRVKKFDLNSDAESTVINLSGLDQGVYLVQIADVEGKLVTKRIIKK